ncbi:hypothetical protein [Kitasatospora sp. NPDC050543]|uniref:hypothetical protein n=1 Tax=Kitasatospora sp. NPDC050543 TaxID=3364054 RepID=UPI00379EEC16
MHEAARLEPEPRGPGAPASYLAGTVVGVGMWPPAVNGDGREARLRARLVSSADGTAVVEIGTRRCRVLVSRLLPWEGA